MLPFPELDPVFRGEHLLDLESFVVVAAVDWIGAEVGDDRQSRLSDPLRQVVSEKEFVESAEHEPGIAFVHPDSHHVQWVPGSAGDAADEGLGAEPAAFEIIFTGHRLDIRDQLLEHFEIPPLPEGDAESGAALLQHESLQGVLYSPGQVA